MSSGGALPHSYQDRETTHMLLAHVEHSKQNTIKTFITLT